MADCVHAQLNAEEDRDRASTHTWLTKAVCAQTYQLPAEIEDRSMTVGRTTYVRRDDQSVWDVICEEKADDLRSYKRDKDWTNALPEDCVGLPITTTYTFLCQQGDELCHSYSTSVTAECEDIPWTICAACRTLALRNPKDKCSCCKRRDLLIEEGLFHEKDVRVRSPNPMMTTAWYQATYWDYVGSLDDLVVTVDDDNVLGTGYRSQSTNHCFACGTGSFSFVRDENGYIVPINKLETNPSLAQELDMFGPPLTPYQHHQ